MASSFVDSYAWYMTADNDRKNLAKIERAVQDGLINEDAAEYLKIQYSDSMIWFREVFHFLGKCFGAPKAAVMKYDYTTDMGIDEPMKIADINPLSPYLVNHRLDADPMRNQFFTSGKKHKIDLSVSSIVTVIVGAQKSLDRAVEKITGKYYKKYVDEVAETAYRVVLANKNEAAAKNIEKKIRQEFSERFISSASETVLSMVGRGQEKIAVELIRELDKIRKPHARLQDVWRVKCLFDLIPQARTFIERIRDMMPDRILTIRDKFYDVDNPTGYRDAKVIINIGKDGKVVPMEIICQVRTFFEFEIQTHKQYEVGRKINKYDDKKNLIGYIHEEGVKEYNLMICKCLEDLFDRVGWNILYSQGNGVSMFDGFPKACTLYYPQKVLDSIVDKLDTAVENEVFHVENAPAKLSQAQECEIFHFMARFVLVAAMPYVNTDWSVPSDTMAGKLFNFVMKEVQRYYKKKEA